jgi:hypothetical protein
LPTITNWYSVVASPALANVAQTLLGLPASFGAINVDQQARVLGQRLNIKDFQNPAKLNDMLNQYVAMATAATQVSPTSTALSLLNNASSSKIINLTLPTTTTNDSYSSASMAVTLLANASRGLIS